VIRWGCTDDRVVFKQVIRSRLNNVRKWPVMTGSLVTNSLRQSQSTWRARIPVPITTADVVESVIVGGCRLGGSGDSEGIEGGNLKAGRTVT
jgi:hypothetical protein